MIYVMGIVGFIGGAGFGLMALHFLLRHKSTEEILHDKMLKYKYGLMGWGMAALGAYVMVQMYQTYFGSLHLP